MLTVKHCMEDSGHACFQELEQSGLLPVVFGKLDSLDDIIRCSAVSQRWKAAVGYMRLTSLCIKIPEAHQMESTMLDIWR